MKTIATFSHAETAHVAKGVLEAAGLEVFLDDSQTPEGKPFLLKVMDPEENRAREVLASRSDLLDQTLQSSEPTPSQSSPRPSAGWIFLQGGGLFLVGYILLSLLFIPVGGRLPLSPPILVLIFFLGGLTGLAALGKRLSSPSDAP